MLTERVRVFNLKRVSINLLDLHNLSISGVENQNTLEKVHSDYL